MRPMRVTTSSVQLLRSSAMTTSYPAWSSSTAVCEPMKPAPPVSKTECAMKVLLVCWFWSGRTGASAPMKEHRAFRAPARVVTKGLLETKGFKTSYTLCCVVIDAFTARSREFKFIVRSKDCLCVCAAAADLSHGRTLMLLHFRAKAAAFREAETMQDLGEICMAQRSRGKTSEISGGRRRVRKSKNVVFGGVLFLFSFAAERKEAAGGKKGKRSPHQ